MGYLIAFSLALILFMGTIIVAGLRNAKKDNDEKVNDFNIFGYDDN